MASWDKVFRFDAFFCALLASCSIQIAANFANDASDAKRGVDSDRVGPPRMVSSGVISSTTMWKATVLVLILGCVASLPLVRIAGWPVIAIGVASVVAMLTYVGGPLPYGYRGFGEISVFIFFGLVATVGTRFVHNPTIPTSAWWLGSVMGLMASAILVSNNLRDIEHDAQSGKRTLAVILGGNRTRLLYQVLLTAAFLIIGVSAAIETTPRPTALALVSIPMLRPLFKTARSEANPIRLIGLLVATARLQLVVSALLAASLILS